ncbi:Cyclin-Dependent Kinase 7 [Didymosphaeria variabile]|uniref:EKC/KEOPS complex subunit BUD32 n=1 Tax=Didymosphaeria variabile TaxID=1932322 RepID=A0A9W8XD66_9PLEO|nr:Cyclin-Dependent Kinase 7 [Didymosphaeria variabile]KAJ4347971.1 Cyclin-Dependent Kinase 7 [Didymosphaeria variabile]
MVFDEQAQVPVEVPSHPNSPRYRFEIAEKLNDNSGQNNAGILLVGDTTTGKYCVEKRLKSSDVGNGRAEREIHILSQLNGHPNVVQLIDFELINNPKLQECDLSATTWMEYCEWGNLNHTIDYLRANNERMVEPLLWHVLESLAEAVRHLQQGPKDCDHGTWNMVYHRDISLSNIFLKSDPGSQLPRVVLGDFGLSTTNAHIKLGYNDRWISSTFEKYFAPPEFPVYYPESDIYQIGAVLYCLMYGQYTPYVGAAPRLNKGQRGWLEHNIWVRELQSSQPYSDDLVSINE